MKRSLFAALVLSSCATGYVRKPPTTKTIAANSLEATVAIVALCEDGSTSIGSGTMVSPTHVATAAHVVMCGDENTENPERLVVVTKDEQLVDITKTIILKHQGQPVDAALATLASPVGTPIPIATKGVDVGETVFVHSKAPRYNFTSAYVQYQSYGPAVVGIDTAMFPGNSGSGVYNQFGELVGVVSTRLGCQGFVVPETCAGAFVQVFDGKLQSVLDSEHEPELK